MPIPETPIRCEDLDLMQLLAAYGEGSACWRSGGALGEIEKAECRRLHSALLSAVEKIFGPTLDRVNAREMQTFTMHNSAHGLKVAHLMWHIIKPKNRQRLTPPEIALLVLSAHLHDLGMGLLDNEERRQRLSSNSDIWCKVDSLGQYKRVLADLNEKLRAGGLSAQDATLAVNQVSEAQDMLLCIDCRERHATPGRYKEIISSFRAAHSSHPSSIPSIDDALHFSGDTFTERLIDICVSHNEDASALLEGKKERKSEPRFPEAYPIGTSEADIRFVAATLRLADILDFDRERVPSILYHYLLPRSSNPSENISVREWQKHMTISNWDFSSERVLFRGRSTNAVAHHAVVEFCASIEEEIRRTNAVYRDTAWPFNLTARVDCDIHSEGFTYHPYRFELNQERIFNLLMGRSLYRDSKDAIRELVQNAIDACHLRDALLRAHRPSVVPSLIDRVSITLQAATSTGSCAKVIVEDSGIGMDRWIIENYFLKVGESYYRSADFLRTNAILWEKQAGFVPVSEFGIGFLSCFMLASHIEVQTAMPSSQRDDSTRRHLDIDGLGRLISVTEFPNSGHAPFEGTRIVLHIDATKPEALALDWASLVTYIRRTCVGLSYPLTLRHLGADGDLLDDIKIEPRRRPIDIPGELEQSILRFDIGSAGQVAEGEIVLFPYKAISQYQHKLLDGQKFIVSAGDSENISYSGITSPILSRGGFSLGTIPGLPHYIGFVTAATGYVQINANAHSDRKYLQTNIARSALSAGEAEIEQLVLRSWLEPLIANPLLLERLSPMNMGIGRARIRLMEASWLDKYSAYDIYLAARGFAVTQAEGKRVEIFEKWERGDLDSIALGIFEDLVHRILFEIALPAVCKLRVGAQGNLRIGAPRNDWIEVLERNNSVISTPIRWIHFAQYVGEIEELLFYEYPGCNWISDKYTSAFQAFTSDDLGSLISLFRKLASGAQHKYLIALPAHEISLLKRAIAVAPDGLIGATSLSPTPLSSFLN